MTLSLTPFGCLLKVTTTGSLSTTAAESSESTVASAEELFANFDCA